MMGIASIVYPSSHLLFSFGDLLLLINFVTSRVRPEDAYGQELSGRTNSAEERAHLLQYLLQRARARKPNQRVRGLSLNDLNA